MISITEFTNQYPGFAFDFSRAIKNQPRVYDPAALATLPVELEPVVSQPVKAGKSLANRNQTRTHNQCNTCERVLRNDQFHVPPSFKARNLMFSYCKTCYSKANAEAYEGRAGIAEARRQVVWQYLAPRCGYCGFDKHASAMDLHHVEGQKESDIASLISHVTLTPTVRNTERLLKDAAKCIPLCANCHRMAHSGAISVEGIKPQDYNLSKLLKVLKDVTDY
jgi:hypothetical protein